MKLAFWITERIVRAWPGLLNWPAAHSAFNRIFAVYALQVCKQEFAS